MYIKFTFWDKTTCFLYKIDPTEYQKTKTRFHQKNMDLSFTKLTKLPATKMQVFYKKILPFWINVFTFLLFYRKFSEIIIKQIDLNTKKHGFHQ